MWTEPNAKLSPHTRDGERFDHCVEEWRPLAIGKDPQPIPVENLDCRRCSSTRICNTSECRRNSAAILPRFTASCDLHPFFPWIKHILRYFLVHFRPCISLCYARPFAVHFLVRKAHGSRSLSFLAEMLPRSSLPARLGPNLQYTCVLGTASFCLGLGFPTSANIFSIVEAERSHAGRNFSAVSFLSSHPVRPITFGNLQL